MNIQDFCDARPYLYHLTDRSNLPVILKCKALLSTNDIANVCLPKERIRDFLRGKREAHVTLSADGISYKVRDQRPIILKVLNRSLSDGDIGDFIELLNKRVFWWPTTDRLIRHFNRYQSENPVILRVRSDEILDLNQNVELCHLNSGATRCHPAYGGNAPTRGKDSFVNPKLYSKSIASVAEVTFIHRCVLPEKVWISDSPNGQFNILDLNNN